MVNGFRTRRLAWEEVLAIHLPEGAPWATLDLADGTTISAMAFQGSDGRRARDGVRQVRALIDREGAARSLDRVDAPRDRQLVARPSRRGRG